MISLISLLIPVLALAGGMTSGDLGGSRAGGEKLFGQPWFTGDRAVDYCLKAGSSFSVPLSAKDGSPSVRRVLDDALKDWRKTLARIDVRPLEEKFVAKGSITTEFREVPCSRPHELTFYLGVQGPEFRDAVEGEKSLPAAFAYVTSYSPLSGRARGYVWLSPDKGRDRFVGRGGQNSLFEREEEGFWKRGDSLYNTLLHELGHVFGFPHLEFTPMSAQVVQLLEKTPEPARYRMTTASLLGDPAALSGSPICGFLENMSYHPLEGHLADRDDSFTRFCLAVGSRSFGEALAGEIPLERSFIGKGPELPFDSKWHYYRSPAPDGPWGPPVPSGLLAGMKETDADPAVVAGRYRTGDGKAERHEFFTLKTIRAWEGTYRPVSGEECKAELRAFNQHAFDLIAHCNPDERVTGYFFSSPLRTSPR